MDLQILMTLAHLIEGRDFDVIKQMFGYHKIPSWASITEGMEILDGLEELIPPINVC